MSTLQTYHLLICSLRVTLKYNTIRTDLYRQYPLKGLRTLWKSSLPFFKMPQLLYFLPQIHRILSCMFCLPAAVWPLLPGPMKQLPFPAIFCFIQKRAVASCSPAVRYILFLKIHWFSVAVKAVSAWISPCHPGNFPSVLSRALP